MELETCLLWDGIEVIPTEVIPTLCPSPPPAAEKAANRVLSSGQLSCLAPHQLSSVSPGQEEVREKRGDSSEDRARESWPCHTSTVKWWWGRVPSAPSPLEAVRRADSEVMRAGKAGLAHHLGSTAGLAMQACHRTAVGVQGWSSHLHLSVSQNS